VVLRVTTYTKHRVVYEVNFVEYRTFNFPSQQETYLNNEKTFEKIKNSKKNWEFENSMLSDCTSDFELNLTKI
jgi:hypothetical protein